MMKKRIPPVGILVYALPAILIYFFSASPAYKFHDENHAALVIGIKYLTGKVHVCGEEEVRRFLAKQAKKERDHLRKRARACGSRERVPLKLAVWLDGKNILSKEYEPSGFHNDENTFVFEKFVVPEGSHLLKIKMHDSRKEGEVKTGYGFERTIDFEKRKIIVVDFDAIAGQFEIS